MTVEYGGRRWTENKSGYFNVTQKNLPGKNWLHQYVYEKEKGAIPAGCHVHHKDRNKRNNRIDNLILLSQEEHSKMHGEYKTSNPERYKKQCEHLDRIRPDHVWPEDPEKYEEHRQALIAGMKNIKPIEYTCENCDKTFEALPNGVTRFCTNKCKSAYRRKSGVDNVDRICISCGSIFTINKYTKTETCSRSCANVIRARTIKNAVC